MSLLKKTIIPLLLLFLFLVIYIHPSSELYVDLGETLLKGQLQFQTHSIITTNFFSYTYPNYSYINLEWLTDSIFYLINSVSGVNGLIIFTSLITLFSLAILYIFTTKRTNILLVSYATVLYLIALYERAAVLPEVFSFLFLSIFIVILYKFREKYTNFIWILIPLELLWVNMHIYFIIGIFLVALFLIEAAFIFKKRDDGKYVRTLLIVLIANCFVSLFNPYGFMGLLYPFVFWQNYGFSVSENSFIFNAISSQSGAISASALVYIFLSLIMILSIILQFRKARMIDLFLSIVFIIGGAIAIRDIGFFVFTTFIPFAFLTDSLLKRYSHNSNKRISKWSTFCAPVLIIILIIWVISQLGYPQLGTVHMFDDGVSFFADNHLPGPIFNNYNLGSYLAYRLYPSERVFVDSRPEAYPASFLQNVYLPMTQNLTAFNKAEQIYHFNTIIYGFSGGVPLDAGFIKYLMQSKEWNVIYIDDSTIIFVKNIKSNEGILQKYSMSDDTFRFPSYQTFNSLFNLAHFLDVMGWRKSEIEALQKMNIIDPKNCQILRNLIVLLGQQSQSASQYITNYGLLYCNQ